MNLNTNLRGRLRNTNLPKIHGLMPVYEAVVNSIHSIEEKNNELKTGQEAITLEIIRSSQKSLEQVQNQLQPIIGFKIIDDGCGFDDANFKSFTTLDSDHKIDKGCRGVGRLLWLKAFKSVEISSVFINNDGCFYRRKFCFNDFDNVYDDSLEKLPFGDKEGTGSVIELRGFEEKYRKVVPKRAQLIADSLLEHCLWYFVREGQLPDISVKDGGKTYKLHELFDVYMHSRAVRQSIDIKGNQFDLTHIRFRASANKSHQLALCAASRLVKVESITGKVPGLYGKISDDEGEFTYTCYVSSKFLDSHVNSERTALNIPDSYDDSVFEETEISLNLIRGRVLAETKSHLASVLKDSITLGKERVDTFISQKAPRYRPITRYVDEDALIVNPDSTDKELELHLHSYWYEIERELVSEGHDVMNPTDSSYSDEYKERLNSYLEKAQDLKTSDLANYVSHRRIIIDLLEKSVQQFQSGNYAKEDVIHELIMPMRKDSTEVFLDVSNLWLLDERLAFHNYLASDKTLNSMPITDSNATKEPDLLSLRLFDNPILVNEVSTSSLASITVIELKRPMRNDMKEGEEKDPIEQSLGYLERVRIGKVKTSKGRPIPASPTIPGYCYVVCDLTPTMEHRCKMHDLTRTADGMGYFGYKKAFESYIEVISFDKLVLSAKERNRAFFDKLGLPCN